MNMIKFTQALPWGNEDTGLRLDTKGRKKQIMIVRVVGKLVCSEARPNEPAFKCYALYNSQTPGFSLANRKCNFCSDYFGNAEHVEGLKTSCVAKAEIAVRHRVCCKHVAELVIKIQSFKVKFTSFRPLSSPGLL